MAHKKAQPNTKKLVRSDNSRYFPAMSAPIHRSRYLRHHRDGISQEEIARQDGVSLDTVKGSIRQTALYYQLSNEAEVHAAEWSLVLATNEAQRSALMEALVAQRPIMTDEGTVIAYEPDHPVRLEAVARINEKLEAMQPKGRMGINVGINTQVNTQVSGGQSGGIYEDRLREIQKKRSENLLPVATLVAEEVEDDDSADSGDEA